MAAALGSDRLGLLTATASVLLCAVAHAQTGSAAPARQPGRSAAPPTAPPTAFAPAPLVVPPPPLVPGEHALPDEEDLARELEEERQAYEAAAAASPRRVTFAPHRAGAEKPQVPAAPVRRRQQLHLTPTEGGVADRGAMSESLRVQPFEMRQPAGFSTIYEVESRPDVLVRGNGAVYAVFPQGDYAVAVVQKRRVVQTLVPAGTMYYIGEPDWRTVWLPGIRGMMPKLRRETPEEYASRTPAASAMQRVEPTMPFDYDGVYLRPLLVEEFSGLGPIDDRIDTYIAPASRSFDVSPAAPLRVGRAPEAAEGPGPTRPTKTEFDDDRVQPPMHSDPNYRRERMRQLLERAAKQSGSW